MIAGVKRARIRKHTKKPLGVLKRKLDSAFSAMVRQRDEGKNCISCNGAWPKKGTQAGHFMRRELLATRWHPLNVHSQCSYCNCWAHGNLLEYSDGLAKRHGDYWPQYLRDLSRTSWKPSREALEQLLAAAKLGHEAYQEIWEFYGSEAK